MHDAKLKAMKDRRGHGIDIHILLGGKPEDKNKIDGETDEMAPDAPMLDEHGMSGMDKEEANESPHEKMMEMAHPELDQHETDSEMMKHMGPHEEMPMHKPRSLGERAKMALMSRMKK